MSFSELFKVMVSAIVGIFIMIAFIPIFQNLGVNFSFLLIFIVGSIIIIILAFFSWFQKLY